MLQAYKLNACSIQLKNCMLQAYKLNACGIQFL